MIPDKKKTEEIELARKEIDWIIYFYSLRHDIVILSYWVSLPVTLI